VLEQNCYRPDVPSAVSKQRFIVLKGHYCTRKLNASTSTRCKSEIVIRETKRRNVGTIRVSSHVLHCYIYLHSRNQIIQITLMYNDVRVVGRMNLGALMPTSLQTSADIPILLLVPPSTA